MIEYGAVESTPRLAPSTKNSIWRMNPAAGVASALITTDDPIGTNVLGNGLETTVPVAKYRAAREVALLPIASAACAVMK
jgi:hypothetical protein